MQVARTDVATAYGPTWKRNALALAMETAMRILMFGAGYASHLQVEAKLTLSYNAAQSSQIVQAFPPVLSFGCASSVAGQFGDADAANKCSSRGAPSTMWQGW